MTPPRKFARYRAFTGSRGGIIPKGSRPRKPPRGVGDAAPYNNPRTFLPPFTPAAAWGQAALQITRTLCGKFVGEGFIPPGPLAAWHTPRQMFHVEHLPGFFVGKTPFLSLLFVL